MSLFQTFFFVFLLVTPPGERAPQDLVIGNWEVVEMLEFATGDEHPLDNLPVMRLVFEPGGTGRMGSATEAGAPVEWVGIAWSIDDAGHLVVRHLNGEGDFPAVCVFLADRALLANAVRQKLSGGAGHVFVLKRLPADVTPPR